MKEITRKTYTIDVSGKILGRVAADIAKHLIGKTNVNYQPHIDAGDFVKVSGASKLVVTGKKVAQKVYYRHTGYPGGLRETKLSAIWEKSASDALRRAVSRMLPKTKHRTARLLRLTIVD